MWGNAPEPVCPTICTCTSCRAGQEIQTLCRWWREPGSCPRVCRIFTTKWSRRSLLTRNERLDRSAIEKRATIRLPWKRLHDPLVLAPLSPDRVRDRGLLWNEE